MHSKVLKLVAILVMLVVGVSACSTTKGGCNATKGMIGFGRR